MTMLLLIFTRILSLKNTDVIFEEGSRYEFSLSIDKIVIVDNGTIYISIV